MSVKDVESGCDPDTIVPVDADTDADDHDHQHRHSLICAHKAFLDVARRRVVYLEKGEFHENCDQGHTHRAPVCLKHAFSKVAEPGEDCSKRTDCHVHFRKDGTAEIHHPAEETAKDKKCRVVNTLRPLT